MEHLNFILTALKDRNVASVAPTSFLSVRSICKKIDRTSPVVLVEYGPGTGAFTRYLKKWLHPDSVVIAIELNREFARRLARYAELTKGKGAKLIVVNGDALDVAGILARLDLPGADYVVSGIPFSFLTDDQKSAIVARTFEVLSASGVFLVYQVSFKMCEILQRQFEQVKKTKELFNIPPLCVMLARKSVATAPADSIRAIL